MHRLPCYLLCWGRRAIVSGGPVVPGPPFHVWPSNCCIHPILYLTNVPQWFLALPYCESWQRAYEDESQNQSYYVSRGAGVQFPAGAPRPQVAGIATPSVSWHFAIVLTEQSTSMWLSICTILSERRSHHFVMLLHRVRRLWEDWMIALRPRWNNKKKGNQSARRACAVVCGARNAPWQAFLIEDLKNYIYWDSVISAKRVWE